MLALPPLPDWTSLHPLVVHFPIGLLLTAPLLWVVAMVVPKLARAFVVAGLVIMATGVAGAFLATATGEAAGELAERSPQVSRVLEEHEHLAEYARNIFAGLLALLLVGVIAGSALGKRLTHAMLCAGLAVFLLGYSYAAVQLANVGHLGGLLVHEYGVHALLPLEGAPTDRQGLAPAQRSGARDDD